MKPYTSTWAILLIFTFNLAKPEFVKNQITESYSSESSFKEDIAKNKKTKLDNIITEYESFLTLIKNSDKIPNIKSSQDTAVDPNLKNRKALSTIYWGFEDLDGHLWDLFWMDPARLS